MVGYVWFRRTGATPSSSHQVRLSCGVLSVEMQYAGYFAHDSRRPVREPIRLHNHSVGPFPNVITQGIQNVTRGKNCICGGSPQPHKVATCEWPEMKIGLVKARCQTIQDKKDVSVESDGRVAVTQVEWSDLHLRAFLSMSRL